MGEEKRFETKIKKLLDDNGCWHVKFFANSYTKKGVPDILACINGKFVAIEVKSSKGKLSELQKYNLRKINECGGTSLVLRPKDYEDFKRLLEYMKEGE